MKRGIVIGLLLLAPALCWGQVVLPFLDGGRLIYEAGGGAAASPYWTDPFSATYTVFFDMSTNSAGNVRDVSGTGTVASNKPTVVTGQTISYLYTNELSETRPFSIYDGFDDFTLINDHGQLTLTNSAGNDDTFTIGCFVYPTRDNTPAANTLFAKDTGTAPNREWSFRLGAGRPVQLFLWDSGGDRIGRIGVDAAPSNMWSAVFATYDGAGADGGISVLLCTNKTTLSTNSTASSSGTYNGMGNTAENVAIASFASTGGVVTAAYIDSMFIQRSVWTTNQMMQWLVNRWPTNDISEVMTP